MEIILTTLNQPSHTLIKYLSRLTQYIKQFNLIEFINIILINITMNFTGD